MDKADQILEDIEEEARRNFLAIIGPQKGQVLAHTVKKMKPKRVLEVGTLVGYSAILMAKNLPSFGKIISLEIDQNLAKIAQNNIDQAGFGNRIKIIVGDAKATIKNLREKFDLLFLDAAKEEYLTYLKLAEPILNPKAVVLADNVKIFANAMADYLQYVRESGRYQSQTFDFSKDAVEVSVRI